MSKSTADAKMSAASTTTTASSRPQPGQEVQGPDAMQRPDERAKGWALLPRAVALPRSHPRGERGMVSAEWAVGLIAAISIAGVLIGVITSPGVRQALLAVVLRIINFISGITIPG